MTFICVLGSKPDFCIFQNLLFGGIFRRVLACNWRTLAGTMHGLLFILVHFVRLVYVAHCFYEGVSISGTDEKLPLPNTSPLIFFKNEQTQLFSPRDWRDYELFSRNLCRPKVSTHCSLYQWHVESQIRNYNITIQVSTF